MLEPKVVSVGNANIDLIIIVDRVPEPDEEVEALNFEISGGGSAANFAVAVSRLGLQSGFIGCLGRDYFGEFLIEEFKKEGVDISQIRVSEKPTGMVIILVERGEKRMIAFRGANLSLKPEHINSEYIRGVEVLHISGARIKVAEKAAEKAKKENVKVSFDPGSIIASMGLKACINVIEKTDILMLNKVELKLLTGAKNIIRGAKTLLEFGPNIIAVKLGSEGSLLVSEDRVVRKEAFQVNVVDTTGAGDAFDAALIYALVSQLDLENAVLMANAAGAISVTRVGARNSLPTIREVKNFLSERGIKLTI